MEFAHDVHEQAWKRVESIAKELFGVFMEPIDGQPGFAIRQGSAVVFVGVHPWHDTATVLVTAFVARGVNPDVELYKFLLDVNAQAVFGAFAIRDEVDVVFSQALIAPTLDPDELKHTVLSVAAAADQLDDEIVARWGGRRGTE